MFVYWEGFSRDGVTTWLRTFDLWGDPAGILAGLKAPRAALRAREPLEGDTSRWDCTGVHPTHPRVQRW